MKFTIGQLADRLFLGLKFPWKSLVLFSLKVEISLIALVIAIPLAIGKIYKRNFIVHNFSELLIYPGIAAVFVPLLNLTSIIILLILISIYDMWAVWKSKIMQKMAKFQMNELKIFGGFYVVLDFLSPASLDLFVGRDKIINAFREAMRDYKSGSAPTGGTLGDLLKKQMDSGDE